MNIYKGSAGGWFKEWGLGPGVPVPAGGDSMEAHDHVKAFSNAGVGINDEGPHDEILDDLQVFLNGSVGFQSVSSATAICSGVLNNFHAYANGAGSFFCQGVSAAGCFWIGSNT